MEKLFKILKSNELSFTVECNLIVTDSLDVTFDLKSATNLQQKILNCRVVGDRQSFQIFRQNTWFLENKRALSNFLYRILHYLISIIKL